MEEERVESDFFVSKEAAARAVHILGQSRIHPQFAGYLALVNESVLSGNVLGLRPGFKSFFEEYFAVGRAPRQFPYLQPFSESGKGARPFNKNIAGSYAPSSLRGVAPLLKLVEVTGRGPGATYNLAPWHEEIALKELALGVRVPVQSLATFMFRDYSIQPVLKEERPEGLEPASAAQFAVLSRFGSIFGYDLYDKADRTRFLTLYELDVNTFEGIEFKE